MPDHIIDIAIPRDWKVELKEREKTEKYKDLAREIRKLWKVKTAVAPVVVDALGTLPGGLGTQLQLERMEIILPVKLLQKTALLGTARILRKVLEL